jgi:hypothetical protein
MGYGVNQASKIEGAQNEIGGKNSKCRIARRKFCDLVRPYVQTNRRNPWLGEIVLQLNFAATTQYVCHKRRHLPAVN